MEENKSEEISPLEILCKRCDGSGRTYPRGFGEDCPRCRGSGYEPTESGRAILDLMEHNFSQMFKKTIGN